MKQGSYTKWVVFCVILIAVVFVAISVFKVSSTNLFFWGILLLCPLMHFWMMKDGGHKH
ncbi:MAG: hypothetical protein ACD_19C00017G0014 [uncultured bacterium]|nr:MAG: hypothetical protein ACD_19C00017G0014 [uncultured bacterium]